MIELEIDGKTVSASEGMTVIQAADAAGIYIPRFCYHEKLSIAANCRQCLVEVEKSRKTLPACATPVTPGMKVRTKSKEAIRSQSTVMQFLLINHPLDCPICDQGGECELQDLALGYGQGYSNYNETKRSVACEDIGPLVATGMTRCIHCTRCVRFGDEIAGLPELGATGRGENMQIGTYVQHFLRSELSGNVIDICPVGALTSKPFRFQSRSWEMQAWPMIAAHDCLGSAIEMHTRHQDNAPQKALMRVVPRDQPLINENWISDRDRFSYEGMQADKRLLAPQMKIKGEWKTVDWPTALHAVAQRCQQLIEQQGADALAAIASPSSSVESLYLLQKMLRDLGSPNLESRLRESDFSDQAEQPAIPGMALSMAELEERDQVLLVGANVSEDQPMWAHRLRQSVIDDVMRVHSIEVRAYPYHFPVANRICPTGAALLPTLVAITSAVYKAKKMPLPLAVDVSISDSAQAIADSLLQSEKPLLVLGLDALRDEQAAQLRAWLQVLSDALSAEQVYLTEGANTAGAAVAGMLPHRGPMAAQLDEVGKNINELWAEHRGLFFLLNCEPEHDAAAAGLAVKALQEAACVVCLNPFATDAMRNYADFILPVTPTSETDGSFINLMGHWQTFSATSMPHAHSKPAWKVLRVLANLLQCTDMEFASVAEVRAQIGYKEQLPTSAGVTSLQLQSPALGISKELRRDGHWPRYNIDSILRNSVALQARLQTEPLHIAVSIHPDTAEEHGLTTGSKVKLTQQGASLNLPLLLDSSVAVDCVRLPAGIPETAGFGCAVAPITIEQG